MIMPPVVEQTLSLRFASTVVNVAMIRKACTEYHGTHTISEEKGKPSHGNREHNIADSQENSD